ncbi:MAG: hypothetical protein N3A63_10195 [Bacteroidetes bacterium]|nr:hypothetical protein [Bacteroidota bacterium]
MIHWCRKYCVVVHCSELLVLYSFLSLSQDISKSSQLHWDISVHDFKPLFHLKPLNQDSTLICWSFATTSFIESEMLRLGRDSVRLSVMFFVYYRLLEKAEHYLMSGGTTRATPGDLFSGVFDIVQKYGIVPASAYEGEKTPSVIYNHSQFYDDFDAVLKMVLGVQSLNKDDALKAVISVLDKYLGSPPRSFNYKGKQYSPMLFRDSVVSLPWGEYIVFTSFTYAPYYNYISLKVPDNWKHQSYFLNIPLNLFVEGVREALTSGYTVAIDADITERSYLETKRWCVIPSVDLKNTHALTLERERMFTTGETTDDHLMHIVGYVRKSNEDWYLVKDSWHISWEDAGTGYVIFHSSYLALKVLSYVVHRNGVVSLHQYIPSAKQ